MNSIGRGGCTVNYSTFKNRFRICQIRWIVDISPKKFARSAAFGRLTRIWIGSLGGLARKACISIARDYLPPHFLARAAKFLGFLTYIFYKSYLREKVELQDHITVQDVIYKFGVKLFSLKVYTMAQNHLLDE